jgi:hypothetical protein
MYAAIAVLAAACSQVETPTSPNQNIHTVTSLIPATWPAPFSGTAVPNFEGRWIGEFRRTDCRATSAGMCSHPFAFTTTVSLELTQAGIAITGVILFPPNSEFGSATWNVDLYVTAASGIAGRALRASTSEASGFIVYPIRFEQRMADGRLGGAFYFDNWDSTGLLVSTRKYDIVTPFRRVE